MKMKWKLRGWLVSLMLFIGMVAVGDAALAYNVSGTIGNSSGKSGRTVVSVQYNGGSDSGLGTCLLSGTGSFTIHGVAPGDYVIKAYMDVNGSGTQNVNEPTAVSGSFTVTSSDIAVGTLNLTLPSQTAPQAIPSNKFIVLPGNNGAMLMWDRPKDNNGIEIADSYNFYWGTAANPGPGNTPGGGTITTKANHNDYAMLGSITNGTAIYVAIEAVNSAGTSSRTSFGPVTINPVGGGATVTGRILTPGITKSGPLYVAVGNPNANPPVFFITRIASPVDTQSWTVTGVTPGTYQVYAILDQNNDHYTDPGDVSNTNGQTAPTITVTGMAGVAAPDVTLSGGNAAVKVNTDHYKDAGGESYNLNFDVRQQVKLPVSATITGGPAGLNNFTPPYDLAVGFNNDGQMNYWVQNIGVRPTVGSQCGITVNYSDGTSDPLTPQITTVLDNFATPTAPVGSVSSAYQTGFYFTWAVASPTPAFPYTYGLSLNSQYGQIWNTDNNNNGIPSTQLSIQFNSDGNANQSSLSLGNTYNWSIAVKDAQGNSATYGASFMPMGTPSISSFNPTSGPVGTSITIYGNNFGTFAAADNTVTFAKTGGGTVAGTVTSFNGYSLTVTVPVGAASGPISVATAGGTTASSGSFTVTLQYILSATVAGTGSGTLFINPPGASITSGTQQNTYDPATQVTLTAAPGANSLLSWSGCDSASGNTCNVTMNSSKNVTATFTNVPAVKLDGAAEPNLQTAFNLAHAGSVVMARAYDFYESSLNLNNPVAFSLQGGYDLAYINSTDYSNLHGVLTIVQGSLTVANFVIK